MDNITPFTHTPEEIFLAKEELETSEPLADWEIELLRERRKELSWEVVTYINVPVHVETKGGHDPF